MTVHPYQRLIPDVPVTGTVPDDDPFYGWSYRVVEAVAAHHYEVRLEAFFDGILTDADGDVHLTLAGEPIARVSMSSHHADARLQILDPR